MITYKVRVLPPVAPHSIQYHSHRGISLLLLSHEFCFIGRYLVLGPCSSSDLGSVEERDPPVPLQADTAAQVPLTQLYN